MGFLSKGLGLRTPRTAPGPHTAARRCVECGAPTRAGKPWCPDHVLQGSPYVQRVLALQQAREQEPRRDALAHRARSHQTLAAQDLVAIVLDQRLDSGRPASLALLAKRLELPAADVERYARALARAGRVTLSRSHRGDLQVSISGGEG